MDEQIVKSSKTGRSFKLKDMVRIINPKQIALYLKHGMTLYDIYYSENLDGSPMIVALFNKTETKYAYDLWVKHELR